MSRRPNAPRFTLHDVREFVRVREGLITFAELEETLGFRTTLARAFIPQWVSDVAGVHVARNMRGAPIGLRHRAVKRDYTGNYRCGEPPAVDLHARIIELEALVARLELEVRHLRAGTCPSVSETIHSAPLIERQPRE